MEPDAYGTLTNIAVHYPGTMAAGIDAWLDAARAAGLAQQGPH